MSSVAIEISNLSKKYKNALAVKILILKSIKDL
mgnify:CR=1 FL=1